MPFVKPTGDLDWRGDSFEAVVENDVRLAVLAQYLPEESEVAQYVRRFLTERRGDAVAEAFGQPEEIAKELAALLEVDGQPHKASALRECLDSGSPFSFETGSTSDPESSEEVVLTEMQYARGEILRYWVDTWLLGWELAGRPTAGLVLSEDLFPSKDSLKDVPDWERFLSESHRYLSDSVALDSDALETVLASFQRRVKFAVHQGRPVELPDGLEVKRIGNKNWLAPKSSKRTEESDQPNFKRHCSAGIPLRSGS